MFELSQRFFFDAAHTLHREIESDGSHRIHGHTYHAEVCCAPGADQDDSTSAATSAARCL